MPEPATCPRCRHGTDGRSPHPPECARCPEGYCTAVPDDRVAATLAGIRERLDRAFTYDDWFRVGRDIPPLVAAVEAVLKQADHFASEADRFGKLSETADEESGAALAALAAWQAYDRCAKTFREAITAALTGQERSDG
jgi:hypothetical protein